MKTKMKTKMKKIGNKRIILTVFVILLTLFLLPPGMVQAEDTDTEEKGYLTFTSSKSFTITPNGKYEKLEYTTGDAPTETTDWQNAAQLSVITATIATDGNYYIYFRGTDNTVVAGYDSINYKDLCWSMTDTDNAGIACDGNIETLLDYHTVINKAHPEMGENCFMYMFEECSSLTKAPNLPAETLTRRCYYGMFRGCTSLEVAPDLPAERLAESCYASMFLDCTSLEVAPDLPVETLEDSCYEGMFFCCTSLEVAPDLPAETLATSCYAGMFEGCTSLEVAPDLPAETLEDSCYAGMFWGCTSLEVAPDLPAETLATLCYGSMFENCSNLIKVPELSANTLADFCYASMFRGCSSLKISASQTEECPVAYQITGDREYDYWNNNMFLGTDSSLTGDPVLGETYYIPAYYAIMTDKESLSLGEKDEGYTGVSNTVTIKGNCHTDFKLTAGLNTDSFILTGITDATYGKKDSIVVTVTPKAGLTAGTYSDVLTVAVVERPEARLEIPVQFIVKEHIYDNDCDNTCNICGQERTVGDHVYDDACDNTCNECGQERTVGDHVYDDACDSSCNICGQERTVGDHVYDDACDNNCNECGQERAVGDHVYDDACDSRCNICGQERTVGEHVYDNACDSSCNICGQERTVGDHVYDDDDDCNCNYCGYVRYVHYPVTDGYRYYATYEGCDFYCNGDGDTRCYDSVTGAEVYNAFKCDGTYTYYFQYDRTAMRDRLTYHPDGEHIIYFDKDGHEVFSDYGHITSLIGGEAFDAYCFFDVYGYMYVDVMTYDITGTKMYYANPYGVLEHTGWFMFSDGGYGYANPDMSLMTNQYTYDWNGNLVYMEANGHIRGTGDGRNLWPASSL